MGGCKPRDDDFDDNFSVDNDEEDNLTVPFDPEFDEPPLPPKR